MARAGELLYPRRVEVRSPRRQLGRTEEDMSLCPKCKDPKAGSDYDGYCIDDWPGYDDCGNRLCRHYRCEHGFGAVLESVYVAPHITDSKVGDKIQLPIGCMNADCPCEVFVETTLPKN